MNPFETVLARLTAAEDALHYVDPSALTAAQNADRAQSLAAIGNALAALSDGSLASLSGQGRQALTELDAATAKMAGELADTQQAGQVVTLVSNALATVTRLVALVK